MSKKIQKKFAKNKCLKITGPMKNIEKKNCKQDISIYIFSTFNFSRVFFLQIKKFQGFKT